MSQLERTCIVEWRRMERHEIKHSQVLFVAETSMSTYYYDSRVSGVLSKILVRSGEYIHTLGGCGYHHQRWRKGLGYFKKLEDFCCLACQYSLSGWWA
jgi:hypothetical protein